MKIRRERQRSDQRPHNKGAERDVDDEAGIEAQKQANGEPAEVWAAAPALGHEIAADHEKHENADKTENALIAGQPDERFIGLAALGDQKGMREHDRQRSDEAQRVEIVTATYSIGAGHRGGCGSVVVLGGKAILPPNR